MKKISLLVAGLLFTAGVTKLQAQAFSITGASGNYSQDFNGLNNSGTATWTDNSNVANWYSQRTGTGTNIVADAGTTVGGNLYSYGTSTNVDRALGTIGSGGATSGSFAHGLQMQNNSGGTVNTLNISYTGEQWRNSAAAAPQIVTFWYKIASSSITALTPNVSTGWTAVSALNFSSPITGGTAGALDGNLSTNRVTITAPIPALTLNNGDYIMLKWDDPDHTGTDHGLAIDDVSITWGSAPTCTPPTVQATVFTPGAITNNSIGISWTAGNGSNVIVVAHQGLPVNSDPVNASSYTANAAFGSGSQIGTGNFVVYAGAGNSVTVTGLTSGSLYYFSIYEYNTTTGTPCYLTLGLSGNATTTGAAPMNCVEIGSIMVDACVPGNGCAAVIADSCQCEGMNELFEFKVGGANVLTSNISINWASGNPWLGLTQNALTATITARLNSSIQGCGFLKEPSGGVLPAGKNVIMFTSTNICVHNYMGIFAGLNDTLYVIYQTYGNSGGHFANSPASGTSNPTNPRTLTMTVAGVGGCTESVNYIPASLTDTAGHTYTSQNAGAFDGSSVLYDNAGNATYVNEGCTPPFLSLNVYTAGSQSTICANATMSMSGTATGTFTSALWTTNGTGSFSSPTTLVTNYTAGATEPNPLIFTLTIKNVCAGHTTTAVSTFSVTSLPAPNPSISSSNGPSICQGGSTVLTASGGSSYVWSPGGTSGSTLTVSAAGTYTASATTSCGTADATFTLTVNALPTVTASASPTSVCAGQPTTITSAGTATSYTWTPGNQNTANITVTPSISSGTQTYTLTASDGNCTNSTTVPVTVNAVPATPAPTATANTICEGQTINLNESVTGVIYTWTGPNSFSSSSQNPSIPNATTVATGTYSLTVTSSGCTSLAGTVAVTVNPIPTISAVPNQTVCSGTALTAINFTTTAGASVNWTNTNAAIGLAISGSGNIAAYIPTATAQQVGTLQATPTFTTGCSGTPVSFTITVNPNPLTDTTNKVIVAANCNQSDGSITGISATGTPAFTYSWNNGATFTASSTLSAVAAGTYNLIIKDGNGCTVNSSYTISNASGPAAPTAQGIPASACQGSTVTPSIGTPIVGFTYTWTATPGGSLGTGTSVTINNIGPSGSYVISVTATDGAGCLGPATTHTITVNPNPAPSISPGNSSFCQGDQFNLSVSPTGTGFTYQWLNGVTPIIGATGSTYNATTAGTYGVQVTDNNTCTGTASTPIVLSTTTRPIVTTGSVSNNPSSCGLATGNVSGVSVANGTPAFTYDWFGSSGLISSSSVTDSLKNVSAGTYTLIVIDSKGCKDTATIAVLSTSASAAPTAANATYCSTQSISPLSATGSGGTLNWYSDATLLTLVGTGSSFTPSPAPTSGVTTYYVAETNGGCTSAATPVSITINTTPSAPTAAGATYCSGATVNALTATGGGGTLTWYSDAGLTMQVGTGSTFMPSPAPTAGITTYYVTETSAATCVSSPTAVSITINTTPPTPTTANAIYCQGDIINALSATSTGGTITWYADAALIIQLGTGSSFLPSPLPTSGTTTYYVTETSAALCTSAATTSSIIINTTPSAPTAASATYCSGATVNALTATSSGGTLTWYSDALLTTQVGTGSPFTPSPIPTSTTTYYVTETSVSGCVSLGASSTITINPNPIISGLGTPDTARCGLSNGSVTGLTTSNGTTPYTYSWTNTSTGAAVGTQQNLNGVGAGTYSLTVTDANTCTASSATSYIVPGTGAVTAAFVPSITQGIAPVTVVFTNASVGANAYQWNFGDGGISTAISPTNVYTTYGTYTAQLIASKGGCTDTFAVFIQVDVNVEIIVPNIFSPNGDLINDSFVITSTGIKDMKCLIYNRWGTLVYTLTAPDQKWDAKMDNGNKASEGTYFYILTATGFDAKEYKKQGSLMLVH